jgi:transcription initiation factor IIE alpha subunit
MKVVIELAVDTTSLAKDWGISEKQADSILVDLSDKDHVPMKGWLHSELMWKIREWYLDDNKRGL